MVFTSIRMKAFAVLTVICFLFMVSCKPAYKKAGKGYEYKILSEGNKRKLVYGDFFEFHLQQIYKKDKTDTVLGDTRDFMPRVEAFDSMAIPPAYIEIFKQAKKGDSIVIRISVDSAYKEPTQKIPAYMSSGGFVYTNIKILDIFENQYAADSADIDHFKKNELKIYTKQLGKFEKELEKFKSQIQTDSKIIKTYLDSKGIKYINGKWGTFIVIHNEGSGKKINYNNVVAVNYTAKTFDSGKVFNSNVDPKFENLYPYEVTMSKVGSVMAGWTDALMKLNEGAKATIYIPSSLAYGKKGFKPTIKPDENIIFDIEVTKMITEVEAMTIVREKRLQAAKAQQQLKDKPVIANPF